MGVILTHQVVDIIQETSNKQIKYCTNLLYLIFSLYWQGWTNRQNSPPVRECLSANTKWLETVNLLFNLSTTLLHGGHGEGKLPKFHYEFVFDVSEDVSSHLMLSTRRKFSILPPSQDESETWNNVEFARKCPIVSFCFIKSRKFDNKT